MRLKLKTAPTVEPVTLADAKVQLRIDATNTDDDTLLGILIGAARRYAELLTNRAIMTQTWTLYLDEFPRSTTANPWASVELPKGWLQSIAHIKYYDADGTEQTLDAGLYTVDLSGLLGRVHPAYGEEWPDTQSRPNAVEIEFTCGLDAAPDDIKNWCLVRVATAFENAEGVTVGQEVYEMPESYVDRLLDAHRIPVVA